MEGGTNLGRIVGTALPQFTAPHATRARTPSRSAYDLSLKLFAFPKADMARLADDDMIQDRDPEQFAGLHEPSRDLQICQARSGIAGRMIVTEDNGLRTGQDRSPKNLARTGVGAVERADAGDVDAENAVFGVEE